MGLSRNAADDNYFGSYYKKTAQALLSQAYSDKEYKTKLAELNGFNSGLAAENSYKTASSNFSSNSEHMYDLGLKNSGFDNYLKGITYLAYRDEIMNAKKNKEDAINAAANDYTETSNNVNTDINKEIAKREEELIKLYLSEITGNRNNASKLV